MSANPSVPSAEALAAAIEHVLHALALVSRGQFDDNPLPGEAEADYARRMQSRGESAVAGLSPADFDLLRETASGLVFTILVCDRFLWEGTAQMYDLSQRIHGIEFTREVPSGN